MRWHYLSHLLLIGALIPYMACAQSKAIYTNPDFSALSKHEKILAIIPFKVILNLRPKDKAHITEEGLQKKEDEYGLAIQNAMETFLLKNNEHKNYTVSFQETDKTNRLLKEKGIMPDSLYIIDPQKIAQTLGVDGIISGTMISNHPFSTGGAIAMDVLVGFGGKTNSGTCTINIHDAATGKVMWKYKKSLSRGLGSDVNTIINQIMKKSSRKFPYNK